MGKLTGKVAVVTGGSAGIGQGIAAGFVAEGARVFITGRKGHMIHFVRFTPAAIAFLTISSIAHAQYNEPALGTGTKDCRNRDRERNQGAGVLTGGLGGRTAPGSSCGRTANPPLSA